MKHADAWVFGLGLADHQEVYHVYIHNNVLTG